MAASISACPSWFNLNAYAHTNRLDFDGWRTQIGNRIFLAGLLTIKKYPDFDAHFAEIQDGPFMDLGFTDNYPSNQAVYPLTYGMADTIVSTLKPLCLKRSDSCDEKLRENDQDGFAMHGRVTVDFNASEVKIIKDFKSWLSQALAKNREKFPRPREAAITKSVIESWHKHQILPYEDLRLWHVRHDILMPSDTVMADWLFANTDGDKDKVRDTRKKALHTFVLGILRELSFAD